ncbi:MAG TPA: valine--tRNA ligase [Acidimicrobiales bacterium]|nr:valine--tRNA ligase [Acidimicrobiales bacterium]
MPERPGLEGLEAKWSTAWEEAGIYRFDRSRARDEVFSIDTPPPTVSGSLHVGHVFSYTQTDIVARYQRMRGKAVFYPIGWDDNGLATERRVQNFFGVRCDPSQPFDPGFEAPSTPFDPPRPISRPNFVDLCFRLTAEDERAFEDLFRRLGMSFDWQEHYTTIAVRARRVSQAAFLRNLARGEAYRQDAPTLWDVDFRTAVAQAELEDRERPGAYHRLRFQLVGGSGSVEIETTRPELVPACVALVAHPDDERYRPLVGRQALTPLFGVPVPIVAHHLAEPDKGTGIAMICTFGDLTDVTWWRELSLPTRAVVERDGRLGPAPFGEPNWESVDPEQARRHYAELEGRTVSGARARIVEMLRSSGALVGEPTPITHPVKFYERGEHPLEIVTSKQWYIRTLALRERLLELGRRLEWVPAFMRVRYENWVEGLTGDWNISRQRFFGVPFPVWYRLDSDGNPIDDALLLPDESRLPIDPSTDVPDGFEEDQRNKPDGFTGDPDVMDTWATSSLTPQIAGGWLDDPDLFGRVFPMDLRPQAHEIIRTWLFSTVVRSELEHHGLPWSNAAISGWILDPDRKKMSKSKGKVIVPTEPIETYGTDAVRYWAGAARLGADTAYDEQQMKVGRRLAIKVLNVARFVLSRLPDVDLERPAELEPGDASMLARLDEVVESATESFERFDYARALEQTEGFFWRFCDDYVELVKARAYRAADDAAACSARWALLTALDAQLRLLAPVLPFATEEAWSWFKEGSVHRAPWPTPTRLGGDPAVLLQAGEVLAAIRKAKSEAHVSMRTPVASCGVHGPARAVEPVRAMASDLCEAGAVESLVLDPAGDGALEVEVVLGERQAREA